MSQNDEMFSISFSLPPPNNTNSRRAIGNHGMNISSSRDMKTSSSAGRFVLVRGFYGCFGSSLMGRQGAPLDADAAVKSGVYPQSAIQRAVAVMKNKPFSTG